MQSSKGNNHMNFETIIKIHDAEKINEIIIVILNVFIVFWLTII